MMVTEQYPLRRVMACVKPDVRGTGGARAEPGWHETNVRVAQRRCTGNAAGVNERREGKR